MQVQVVVRLINVKPGENKNWLIFEAYAGALDRNRKYILKFCGTEMEHSLSLIDDEIEELRRRIGEDFGYPPFDVLKAKSVLGKGKNYTLSQGKSSV